MFFFIQNRKMSATLKQPIAFSVDLVEQTRHHIAFLQTVWHHEELFTQYALKPALIRYRELWLPLLAKKGTTGLEPPLDVHWIWYLHMMKPLMYHRDCLELIGTVPSHWFVFLAESRHTLRERTRLLWEKYYPTECFTPDPNYATIDQKDETDPFAHIIEDTDVIAVRNFIYQILLPHYIDPSFLSCALERYHLYLQTRKTYPECNIAPIEVGYDIELLYRSHLSRPLMYQRDVEMLFDNLCDFRIPNEAALNYKLLQNSANQGLVRVPGAMFRGDLHPLFYKMAALSADDIFTMAHKECHLAVKRIRVEHLNHQNIAVVLGIAKWDNLHL